MRTTTRALVTSAALIGTAGTLTGLSTSTATAAPETVRERGVVLECTGSHRGRDVRTEVYQNGTYGNSVTVTIGDPERGGVHGQRNPRADVWSGRTVRATVRVDGRRATVSGPARRVGARIAVHEDFDDAGEHIVTDGFHRRVATDLVLAYRGEQVDLTCAEAFFYDLRVTKTPLA